ncbi:hypothetical protein EDD16DRAFT_1708752 [Pisolithus croceorrhizus]|nr:hypothetical protein EDD16DRAFT_1708752 [Pisolithus croceorrhizus]
MLSDYSPEIPVVLLQRLLLRDAHDIQWLCLVYNYVCKHHSGARSGWSVFSDQADANHFAVCYFNEDLPLQNLRDHIVNAAHQELEEKILELKQLIEWYKDIQRWAAEMDHDYKHTGLGKRKHIKRKCKKCKLESTKIEITVHEWSLPEGPCQVALVVFELNHPVAFDMWHSVICLLLDICSPPLKRRGPHTCLRKYSTLLSYHAEHTRSRIMLVSDVKPIIESHYCSIQVLTEESKVCINNGLSFYYYDKHSEVSPIEAFHAVDISVTCSHQLPPGSYQNLQHFLQDTTHTSNQVLCSQAACDKDLSTHEYMAYGHL